jgi:hypothetical protein
MQLTPLMPFERPREQPSAEFKSIGFASRSPAERADEDMT